MTIFAVFDIIGLHFFLSFVFEVCVVAKTRQILLKWACIFSIFYALVTDQVHKVKIRNSKYIFKSIRPLVAER